MDWQCSRLGIYDHTLSCLRRLSSSLRVYSTELKVCNVGITDGIDL
jgi:hypothetical protein